MRSPFAWWHDVQSRRQAKEDKALWRKGYDFAAGYLLREGMPTIIERLIRLDDEQRPSRHVDGMRCAVRDYNARLTKTCRHHDASKC